VDRCRLAIAGLPTGDTGRVRRKCRRGCSTSRRNARGLRRAHRARSPPRTPAVAG